jgi:hypothetical protein
VFALVADRAHQSNDWTLHVLDTGHDVPDTLTRATADLLIAASCS